MITNRDDLFSGLLINAGEDHVGVISEKHGAQREAKTVLLIYFSL